MGYKEIFKNTLKQYQILNKKLSRNLISISKAFYSVTFILPSNLFFSHIARNFVLICIREIHETGRGERKVGRKLGREVI